MTRLGRRAFLARAAAEIARSRGDFARDVEALSGAETGPHADNLITNEDSFGRIACEVAARAPAGSAYLGVGPDQNLTLIAHARPSMAVVVDFRRRNLLVQLVHKALLSLADDRAGYLSRLMARRPVPPIDQDSDAAQIIAAFGTVPFDRARLDATILEVAGVLRPLGVVDPSEFAAIATIQAKLAGPGLDARFLSLKMYPTLARLIATPDRLGRPAHFLAAERLYRTTRDLERLGRVVPAVGDFADPSTFRRLANWLGRVGLRLGTFYASDVEFFLLRSGKLPAYAAGLARLPWADRAILVRTSTREINHTDRVAGDSSTTIVRSAVRFVADATAGRIRGVDDLFRPE